MEQLSRITPATADVLEVLRNSAEATWGLHIIKATGRPPGSVYPILERLERLGWVTSSWESDSERAGPRRRLYELTSEGAVAAPAVINRARTKKSTASKPRVAGAGA